MSSAASPAWELLAWDSSHFGFATARIRGDLPAEELEGTLQAMRQAGVRLAYYAVPSDQSAALDAAQRLGGRLVDRKTTYAGSVAGILAATQSGRQHAGIVEAFGPLTDALRELAFEAGAFSRFRVDPDFPRPAFELLYSEWMERSLQRELAGAVFVVCAARDVDPLGVVTVAEKGGRAEIGLIAVSARGRGQGRGQGLVRRAALWARDAGLSSAQVITQGDNVPACRLYERCGYSVEAVQAVFHFWTRQT